MDYRYANINDLSILTQMNRQLTEDEKHSNRFKSEQWFKERMESFLNGDYEAILFENQSGIVAYALYRDHPDHDDTISLRQIFVVRDQRRKGIGREIMEILMHEIWSSEKRLTVEVLSHNEAARKLYASVGYKAYCVELEIKKEERRLSAHN